MGSKLGMACWTGDMQLTTEGRISRNQAEGKTVITLDKSAGKASMDIGGGFGQEKWVMTLEDGKWVMERPTNVSEFNTFQASHAFSKCLYYRELVFLPTRFSST